MAAACDAAPGGHRRGRLPRRQRRAVPRGAPRCRRAGAPCLELGVGLGALPAGRARGALPGLRRRLLASCSSRRPACSQASRRRLGARARARAARAARGGHRRARRAAAGVHVARRDRRAAPLCRAAFFARSGARGRARPLGCTFLFDGVGGRMVEAEAYRRTIRLPLATAAGRRATPCMFGPPGHLYVYFTYGMHFCANVVCEDEGGRRACCCGRSSPSGRSSVMAARRGLDEPRLLAAGPARLAQALGIGRDAERAARLAAPPLADPARRRGGAPPSRDRRATRAHRRPRRRPRSRGASSTPTAALPVAPAAARRPILTAAARLAADRRHSPPRGRTVDRSRLAPVARRRRSPRKGPP